MSLGYFRASCCICGGWKLDGLKQLTIEKNLEGQKCFSRFSLFFDCHVFLLRPYRAPLRFALRNAGNIVPVWQEFLRNKST